MYLTIKVEFTWKVGEKGDAETFLEYADTLVAVTNDHTLYEAKIAEMKYEEEK